MAQVGCEKITYRECNHSDNKGDCRPHLRHSLQLSRADLNRHSYRAERIIPGLFYSLNYGSALQHTNCMKEEGSRNCMGVIVWRHAPYRSSISTKYHNINIPSNYISCIRMPCTYNNSLRLILYCSVFVASLFTSSTIYSPSFV